MKVIILNGPMGVGKTTVGKYIAETQPGTAFIDGDWCLDLHPFVGNREMKTIAIDNILHMIGNYSKCLLCKQIVLVWLMDDAWVLEEIRNGIAALGLELVERTLICSQEQLIRQWKADTNCEWRTDEWLTVSIKSLNHFQLMDNCLNTDGLSIKEIAELCMC